MDESKVKCSRCHCWRDRMEYLKKNRVLKSCVSCRQNDIKQRDKQKCEHGRQKATCKECGGGSICEHGRRRSQCVECGGGAICQHNRQRTGCKECGGSSICQHNRIRSQCKECGGSAICQHNRIRSNCVECGGSAICQHNKRRDRCVECGGTSICPHKRHNNRCQICNFNLYLVHRQRRQIKRCFQYTCLKKTKSSIKYLGCDIDTFISHMEKKLTGDMTWDNIHIDHIKPVSRFNLDLEEEFNKCCHYTNLQPLLAKENMNKSNKWTDENDKYWNENIIYKDYDKIYL